jgi:glyoxylate/hydroxypyruvate reductase A
MSLVIHLKSARREWWKSHLQSLLPEINCLLWDEVTDSDDVRYAVVWKPPTGGLASFKNLQCIVSVGAGIDHVLADHELPVHVPIIRTTGSDLTQRMREYVCMHVLIQHRHLMDMLQAQHSQQWAPVITPTAANRTVGIMGLGKLGHSAAQSLLSLGFNVVGWARSEHRITGVTCYTEAQLPEFLHQTNILVCLLPLTKATGNILNKRLFQQLPEGAAVINAGRGEHLHEQDLLDALDSSHISHATLDVFRTEPLPAEHPFWSHPKITITPHIASMIDPESGGKEIARNLKAFINGEPVEDLTDRTRGY